MTQHLTDDGHLLGCQRRRSATDLPGMVVVCIPSEGVVQVGDTDHRLDDRTTVTATHRLSARRQTTLLDTSPNGLGAAMMALGRSNDISPFFFGHQSPLDPLNIQRMTTPESGKPRTAGRA
ncbi:hypothetical protein [Paenarthrobacter ureafaciens]|uniref:hypothetical protein n=1 Tax=Paenarthrobacter ureafaciens TaxID=37931 RepID=UPI003464550C